MAWRRYLGQHLVCAGLIVATCGVCSCARSGGDLSALTSDNLDARLRAIAQAGRDRDERALYYLVAALDDDQSDVRLFAILALERITGTTLGYVYYADRPQRQAAVQRWQQHLREDQAAPTEPQEPPRRLLASGPEAGP